MSKQKPKKPTKKLSKAETERLLAEMQANIERLAAENLTLRGGWR